MRPLRALGVALLVAGMLATVLGAIGGDIQLGLALFFIPYLQSSSWLGALAILLVFAGVAILILDSFYALAGRGHPIEGPGAIGSGEQAKTEFGGVVLVGPIPIVFGSSSRTALLALIAAAAIIMMIMLVLLLQ
ncbi:MAG TPA: DUF131 domain-containing protein [Methanomassiliicoccales archaeon]|nr:DUF131 domain-containing protein [Methanomassiliicoccales archaeon]